MLAKGAGKTWQSWRSSSCSRVCVAAARGRGANNTKRAAKQHRGCLGRVLARARARLRSAPIALSERQRAFSDRFCSRGSPAVASALNSTRKSLLESIALCFCLSTASAPPSSSPISKHTWRTRQDPARRLPQQQQQLQRQPSLQRLQQQMPSARSSSPKRARASPSATRRSRCVRVKPMGAVRA